MQSDNIYIKNLQILVHLSKRGVKVSRNIHARIRLNTGFNKKTVKSCVEFYRICYILVVDRRII